MTKNILGLDLGTNFNKKKSYGSTQDIDFLRLIALL